MTIMLILLNILLQMQLASLVSGKKLKLPEDKKRKLLDNKKLKLPDDPERLS